VRIGFAVTNRTHIRTTKVSKHAEANMLMAYNIGRARKREVGEVLYRKLATGRKITTNLPLIMEG
jgi:hypothetical protein